MSEEKPYKTYKLPDKGPPRKDLRKRISDMFYFVFFVPFGRLRKRIDYTKG